MSFQAGLRSCGAVAVLLLAVAPASAADLSGRLLAAASGGDAAQLAALLRGGADANARDASARPALLVAATSGRPEGVRALLRGGAAPDASDRGGWTALHEAARSGDLASARLLLDAGATPDLRARSGGTPLDVAERGGRRELAALLRAHGARGSGKSIGDTVCVRRWRGDGFCAEVAGVDATRFRLRVTEVVGCGGGCAADTACSAGRSVGLELASGAELWVPASCLTHTGVAR